MLSPAGFWVTCAAAALSAGAFALYLRDFLREAPDTAWANRVLDLSAVALTATLLAEAHAGPFVLPVQNRYQALLFFAWSLLLVYEGVGRRLRLERFGLVLSPLVFVVIVGALASCRQAATRVGLTDTPWFWVHALSAFLAYAAFALSFVSSVLYLMQERGLKARPPRRIFQALPTLSTLEQAIARTILIGMPLLTLALASGIVWLRQEYGVSWQWREPKFVSSLLTWVIYGALLAGCALHVLKGRRIALLSLVGFVLVVFTFLGTDVIAVGLHRFLG